MKIIVFEGPDKIGKSTQCKLLMAKMPEALHVKIPFKDEWTHSIIYRMLASGEATTNPVVFQLTQWANRILWWENIGQHLSNSVLVLDRWYISSLVYGKVAGLSNEILELATKFLPKPDLVFVMRGQGFKAPEREDDCYERDKAFQRQVQQEYTNWAEQNPGIAHCINADNPIQEIHDLIWSITKRL